ncbi:MAG TPA: glycosyltransferase [Steroidobacteraceae bacterium]|nr:glycosyltransferase [Steroidobacteraceae bacterium]
MSPKIRVVAATRETAEDFAGGTALGRSLSLYPTLFELRLFPSNSSGLPLLYNTAIRESAVDPAILVFIHDDVHLLDFYWSIRVMQGLAKFDILGLAGNRRRVAGQPAWRFLDDKLTRDDRNNLSGVVAHGKNWPADYISAYGSPGHEVKLLDGVMLAAHSRTLISKNVLFDEAFDFHFYDLDFCRTAEQRGLRMGTWGISVMHESDGAFGTHAWRQGYERYVSKWKS